jgi:hypothetical protein
MYHNQLFEKELILAAVRSTQMGTISTINNTIIWLTVMSDQQFTIFLYGKPKPLSTETHWEYEDLLDFLLEYILDV